MKIDDIKTTIKEIFGKDLAEVDVTTQKNGIYSVSFGGDKYVIAMIGASQSGGRTYCQMQKTIKPKILKAYEESKNEQSKFFLMVPDSSKFSCDDYYIFIELMDKGGDSSSFEINVPTGGIKDYPVRIPNKSAGKISSYITFVPAKDSKNKKTSDLLRLYFLSFDSRPYSKYITKITDFLPGSTSTEEVSSACTENLWPQNFLVAGAPGTGKSFLVNKQIKEAIKRNVFSQEKGEEEYSDDKFDDLITNLPSTAGVTKDQYLELVESERVRRVTFYEDYSYENFVGCYKPVPVPKSDEHSLIIHQKSDDIKVEGSTGGKQITYEYIAGPFINTYVDAMRNPGKIYFLIVEEINRARAASVFGDMFQLLDRKQGVSEYGITPDAALDDYLRQMITQYKGVMKLPKNMYIWATMNNADQGVFSLDSAFKRRWGYLYLDVNTSQRDGDIRISPGLKIRWNIFRKYLNEKILENATEDKCIGAWYFKEEEFKQVEDYFGKSKDERLLSINPLADKLLIYLLNDIFRMDPTTIFEDGFTSMPDIREALLNGVGLDGILKLNWSAIKEGNKDYKKAASVTSEKNEDVTVEVKAIDTEIEADDSSSDNTSEAEQNE